METVSRDENLLAEKKLLSALNNLPPLPDISKHFCAKNAKILAVFSVIGFIIYHSVLLETLGKNLKIFFCTTIYIKKMIVINGTLQYGWVVISAVMDCVDM